MSLPFSRSIRSLNIDSYQASRIGMALGILIMIALLLWFFLVKVTIYEFSTDLDYKETGILTAGFPKENLSRPTSDYTNRSWTESTRHYLDRDGGWN